MEHLCLQVQEVQVKYESHSLLGTHSQPPPIREPSGKGLGGEEGQAGRLGKPRPLPSPGFRSSCTDKVFYPFPILGDLPDLVGPLHFSPISTESHFTLNPGHLGLTASSHPDLRQLSPCPKPQHGDFKVHLDDTISAAAICQNTVRRASQDSPLDGRSLRLRDHMNHLGILLKQVLIQQV